MEAKLTLDEGRRKAANAFLDRLSSWFHDEVPIEDIQSELGNIGIVVLSNDLTEFSGSFNARSGNVALEISDVDNEVDRVFTPYDDVVLSLFWHHIRGGKIEISCFIASASESFVRLISRPRHIHQARTM